MSTQAARPPILASKRVVIKLGTRVLSEGDEGIARNRLRQILKAVAILRAREIEILLVTSGGLLLSLTSVKKTPKP